MIAAAAIGVAAIVPCPGEARVQADGAIEIGERESEGFAVMIRPAAIWLAGPFPASGQAGPEDDPARFRVIEILGRCSTGPGDEIVVCGRRNQDRYRLPQFGRREAGVGVGNARGEAPRASTDISLAQPCGIFQGQRRCSREEMAEFGYFQGRDPVTFLGDLVTVLVDPDADVRAPPLP